MSVFVWYGCNFKSAGLSMQTVQCQSSKIAIIDLYTDI